MTPLDNTRVGAYHRGATLMSILTEAGHAWHT
jgi:hypothetical protein